MNIQQISVFLENRTGQLAELTQLLADKGINLRAISVAETADYGILRMIVDEPDKTKTMLTENGFLVALNTVIGIQVGDNPGGAASVLKILSDSGISIDYMYAFSSRVHGKACIIIRTDAVEKTIGILSENNIEVLGAEDLA